MNLTKKQTMDDLKRYIETNILSKKDWYYISTYQKLSETFIEKHADKVDWYWISLYQKLSETFIEKHMDKVDWDCISVNQQLSEEFIEKHADKVDWYCISQYQKLSETFIEKYADKVDWNYISIYQKLSEEFIEKYADKVDWYFISQYQKLSETFIEKYADKVHWYYISKYQKLSEAFIEKHTDRVCISLINDNWLYKEESFLKQAVIDTGLYECYEDYFIAYKGIRSNRYSKYNFQYQYLAGETYETFADASGDENSFGFSAWTKKEAEKYCNELVVTVKVYYKDIARVVHGGGKIRCFKMTVLD